MRVDKVSRDLSLVWEATRLTSQLFYDLTGPLLYSSIITDYLPLLAVNLHSPPASRGLRSKKQLLASCKRLFIEYVDKGEPSYSILLSGGAAFFLLFNPSEEEKGEFGNAETVWIAAAGRALDEGETYCSLVSLSTGAFLGGQQAFCGPVWDKCPKGSAMAARMLDARLAISGLAEHQARPAAFLCQRVEFGPLTYVSQLPFCDKATLALAERGPDHLMHFDTSQCGARAVDEAAPPPAPEAIGALGHFGGPV
jgi:hypothetical protein